MLKNSRLRIAQVSPLWTRIPPTTYGGIELMMKLLIDKLVARGHEVPRFEEGKNLAFLRRRQELLRNAAALLFPIQWEEPFGLVMIEAMACGTPVVAHRRGSVGEVVKDGGRATRRLRWTRCRS